MGLCGLECLGVAIAAGQKCVLVDLWNLLLHACANQSARLASYVLQSTV